MCYMKQFSLVTMTVQMSDKLSSPNFLEVYPFLHEMVTMFVQISIFSNILLKGAGDHDTLVGIRQHRLQQVKEN